MSHTHCVAITEQGELQGAPGQLGGKPISLHQIIAIDLLGPFAECSRQLRKTTGGARSGNSRGFATIAFQGNCTAHGQLGGYKRIISTYEV